MNAPLPPKTDFNVRVAQYVKLRDKITKLDDAHKEVMKPYREALADLNSALLNHLNQVGAENVKTEAGTVYKTEKKSASIADQTAFWTFVTTQGEWDLLDRRANVTAVADYIQENGVQPPGINFSIRHEVGVRRK